ncbi:hypothetical protein K4F52_004493 [Lecanicillium sp. MT-2017a]|nr:hypothetical protein K4F52_004493 [Lecanicillium sp. MT-2017a]
MEETSDSFTVVERDMVPAAPRVKAAKTIQQLRKEVLTWLQPTDYLSPGNEYMKHLHAYLPGTGNWVEESPIFRSWRAQDDDDDGTDTDSGYHRIGPASANGPSCLHIRGIAGSGKSVFSASTIDQLQTAGNIVLFFFFRQIVDKNHAAKYLVRDFAAQIVPHSDALARELAELSKNNSVTDMGIEPLWSAISKVMIEGGVNKQVFCVIDALDEMDDDDFPDMMEKIIALGSANPQTVKAMFTGRPLLKIEQAIQRHKAIAQLKLDPVLLSPDVAHYIDARMAALQPQLSDDKFKLVKHAICERARGLFLHARLVTDNLAQSLRDGRVTEETLPDSLERLPRSLREVYEEMLKDHARRSGVSEDHQAKILTCVTHSSRPMRLIELGSLVAQMLGVDLRKGKDLIRASCGPLLELLEDEIVSVIHHSFTEFLQDGARSEFPNAFPVLGDSRAHDILAAQCLEYLDGCPHFDMSMDETREVDYGCRDFVREENKRRDGLRTQLRLSHPLAAYAVENLAYHFGRSGNQAKSVGLAALNLYFLPKRPAFETWALMNWLGKLTSSINALHLLLDSDGDGDIPLFVVQHLVETDTSLIHLCDPCGHSPLICASQLGRHDVVEFLLSKGANPEAAKLVYDMEDDYSEVYVEYDEDEAEKRRETALSIALRGYNSNVALQFIPFMPAEEASTYFHAARTPETLEAILQTGLVDVNSSSPKFNRFHWTTYEQTKLVAAAHAGKLDMVKLLLKHGADPNKRESNKPTALHSFAGAEDGAIAWYEKDREKAIELVRVLVDAGAKIDAVMDHENKARGPRLTALHIAVKRGEVSKFCWGAGGPSEEVRCEALLKAGADPNATTGDGDTPIHRADARNRRLIQLLVNYGAEIDRKNDAGRSPFLNIINGLSRERESDYINSESIAKSLNGLLDLGADPSVIDNYGNNAFHYIIQSIEVMGHPVLIPLVERLLKTVDPNHKNCNGDAPIFWYKPPQMSPKVDSKDGSDEKLLRVLLRGGMKLEIRNREGHTLLHYPRGRRLGTRIADMEKFIRLGADPNALGPNGTSILQEAVKHDFPLVWLEYLAEVNTSQPTGDENGNTIIHNVLTYMDRGKVEKALDLVIANGADPLAKNNKGQTAIHVATPSNALFAISSPHFRRLNFNERDSDGLTPLHSLARYDEDAVWELLQRGCDAAVRSHTGLLPLHCAAQAGKAGVVSLLIAQYQSQPMLLQDINSLGGGQSPLHYACQAGSAATASVLLRYGADPRLSDENGLTPLHTLSRFVPIEVGPYHYTAPDIRTPEIVRMLHRHGADINATVTNATGGDESSVETTALDLAVGTKRWEVVRELLACGASVRDQHRQSHEFLLATDKEMALEATCKIKCELHDELSGREKEEKLEDRYYCHRWRGRWSHTYGPPEKDDYWILGPQSLYEVPEGWQNGLMYKLVALKGALTEHDFDTVREFHEHGGDDVAASEGEGYFLAFLIENGYEHLLRYFEWQLRFHTTSEHKTMHYSRYTSTLLGVACANKTPSMNIIEWLVDEIGFDVDASNIKSIFSSKQHAETPLHILAKGCSFWHLQALKYLLSKGADVEVRTDDGLTPLLLAFDERVCRGRWSIEAARLLLEYGANVNARTNEPSDDWDAEDSPCYEANTYALDLAKTPEEIQLLLSAGADITLPSGVLIRSVRMWMCPEAISLLLKAGSDPNEEPSSKSAHSEEMESFLQFAEKIHVKFNRRFALHEAARPPFDWDEPLPKDLVHRRIAVTELLLSHGADPYATYPDGSFVLQNIVEDRGLATTCLSLIKNLKVDLKGSYGRTLLIQACVPCVPFAPDHGGQKKPAPIAMSDTILMLLEKGADVTLGDEEGRTALHWMCTQTVPFDAVGQEAFKALVARDPSTVKIADNKGRLPHHLALEAFSCKGESMDFAIRHLIASGAEISTPDPVSGNSALHHIGRSLAADEEETVAKAMALFKDLAVSLDITARNDAGESVVAAAIGSPYPTADQSYSRKYAKGAASAYVQVLQFLIGCGAKLDTTDTKGRNLLHVAAERHIDDSSFHGEGIEGGMIKTLFEALLDHGVDPHCEDGELRTPIDIAVARKLKDVVKLFSEEGKRAAEERKAKKDDDDSDVERDAAKPLK